MIIMVIAEVVMTGITGREGARARRWRFLGMGMDMVDMEDM